MAGGRTRRRLGARANTPSWAELARLREHSHMLDAVIDELDGRTIRIGEDWLIDFASCNYLGFDLDPQVRAAIDPMVAAWGTHPSWSRLLGNPRPYLDIEERLTELLGAPDTLVLSTVTLIHAALIPMLAGQGRIVFEAAAHKTIFDACEYSRGFGADVRRFATGDLDELERQLRARPARSPRLVCIDGVNSMTGNIPDLAAMIRICQNHDAMLYVDDAHGFGVIGERRLDESCPYGARGNSVVRHLGLSYDNVILVGGFSKAYSSLLAFIALPKPLKNRVKVAAAPYLYSGPSPIASLATVLAGFEVNDVRGDDLRAHLYALTNRVLTHLDQLGVMTANTSGLPIIELPLAPNADVLEAGELLWRLGIYVTLAPYPMVPRDQAGFRIQLTAAHTHAQVDQLIFALSQLHDEGRLRRR